MNTMSGKWRKISRTITVRENNVLHVATVPPLIIDEHPCKQNIPVCLKESRQILSSQEKNNFEEDQISYKTELSS